MFEINEIKNNELDKLMQDLNDIMKLNHPSLLKFIGYSPTDFNKRSKPVIVTEYSLNGSLKNINDEIMNDTIKLIIIYGIASGMSYLHSKNIIHRSLNIDNIYIDEFLTPKLGDYGLSTRFENTTKITYESISGFKAVPVYLSPEVLQYNQYSKSSDVYSFAFVVYELMTNKIPFEEISNKNRLYEDIVKNNKRPIINENIPKPYINLIEKCWSQKQADRPTFDDIVLMLKNDSGFISDKIDKKLYHEFINLIDQQTKLKLADN